MTPAIRSTVGAAVLASAVFAAALFVLSFGSAIGLLIFSPTMRGQR